MKLESNVTNATIVSSVPHPTLKGVTLEIVKRYEDGKWREDRVNRVMVPKGTRRTSDGKRFYISSEDHHEISPGYREKSVYFVLPGMNTVYSFNHEDVAPAKNTKTTKALLKFVQYSASDLPKILSKLKAAKAQFVRTENAGSLTLLVFNGKCLNIGCFEAYEILLKEGIISKDGHIVKTRLPMEIVATHFHSIDHILIEIGNVYAQTI